VLFPKAARDVSRAAFSLNFPKAFVKPVVTIGQLQPNRPDPKKVNGSYTRRSGSIYANNYCTTKRSVVRGNGIAHFPSAGIDFIKLKLNASTSDAGLR
jgi:hypothetical protein